MARKKGTTKVKCIDGQCCIYDKKTGDKVRCFAPKKGHGAKTRKSSE